MADEHDPVAFKAKLQAWRDGGMNVTFGGKDGHGSKNIWHNDQSRWAKERDQVADLKAAGLPFDRAPS